MNCKNMKVTLLGAWAGLLGLLLCGCVTGGAPKPEAAVFDLSDASSVVSKPATTLQLRLAGIQTPVWLDSNAMQYRLTYAEAERRWAYAGSRWAATPAELVELTLLRQGLAHKGDAEAGGCQLQLGLDEFIQKFETPEQSVAQLDMRVALFPPGKRPAIARTRFHFSPAAGGDAKAGVAGFNVAMRDLSKALDAWLVRLERESPAAVAACRV